MSWILTPFLMAEFGCLASTLLFQAQLPWHEKHLQKGWPSGLCPNGLSCTVYHATSGLVGGYRASWQYEDRDTCPSCRCHGPERKSITLLMCFCSRFLLCGYHEAYTRHLTGNTVHFNLIAAWLQSSMKVSPFYFSVFIFLMLHFYIVYSLTHYGSYCYF